jgi:hypothetical protein
MLPQSKWMTDIFGAPRNILATYLKMNIVVYWDLTLCCLINHYQFFRQMRCLHLNKRYEFLSYKSESTSFSETLHTYVTQSLEEWQ